MKRINPRAVISSNVEANGYLKLLKNNGVFEHMIDGYMFAAAYAIKNNLDISHILVSKHQDIALMDVVDDKVRLALEAGIYAICKLNNQPQPTNEREVLEILTRYAEAGLMSLKQRWEGKVSTQIQDDIRKIISFE